MTEEQFNEYSALKRKLDNRIEFLRKLKHQIDIKHERDNMNSTFSGLLRYFAKVKIFKRNEETVLRVATNCQFNDGVELEADEDLLNAFMQVVAEDVEKIKAQMESL